MLYILYVNGYVNTGWEYLCLVVDVEFDNEGRFGEHCVPNLLK